MHLRNHEIKCNHLFGTVYSCEDPECSSMLPRRNIKESLWINELSLSVSEKCLFLEYFRVLLEKQHLFGNWHQRYAFLYVVQFARKFLKEVHLGELNF